ncbi:MAG: hypothetical protein JJ979_22485 [Roseibium sp.]|nr:hypothetical protein [Roseibium sp.]
MIAPSYVVEMAAYSRWQNDNIYRICDEIGEEERVRDRGLFSGRFTTRWTISAWSTGPY